MKKYFTDIKKPKWYLVLLALVFFTVQCSAIINLCANFGGGYYLLIPLQVLTGYLDVLFYLMVQKDMKVKGFWLFGVTCLAVGAVLGFLIFDGVYTSVPGAKGVLFGVSLQITLAFAVYALFNAARNVMAKKPETKS